MRTILIILGFLLFISGFIALILMLVGLQLSYLTWIDAPSRTFGLVIRLAMILGGLIMVYLANNRS
jgi:uncharacterized membrane protein